MIRGFLLQLLMRPLHSWDNSGGVNGSSDPVFAFREEQLEFRKHEIYLAYSAFRRLVLTGERGDLRSVDESPLDWESWTGDWVRCDEDVSLVGHSFGGATLVSSLLFHLSRHLLT
jgi:platelet-activating factor acetylhydrolase